MLDKTIRNKHALGDITFLEILVVPHNSQSLASFHSFWNQQGFAGKVDAFPSDWEMKRMSRQTANISAGPFNRMMSLSSEQAALVHGTTPFPQVTTGRKVRPKSQLLRDLVRSIACDLQSLGGTPGADLSPGSIYYHASIEEAPFFWLRRDYSEEFSRHFLGTLLINPLLLCILAQVATHTRIGSLVTSVQGFPGSGKTHIMVLVATVLAVSLQAQILWTTKGNEALKSAANLFDKLCGPQETEIVARLLASGLTTEASVDIAADDRSRTMARRSGTLRIILMTSSAVKFDLSRKHPLLEWVSKPHFVMQDEAQQFGNPDDAVVLSYLDDGLAIHIGDRKQPSVFIDRRKPAAAKVIEQICQRQLCINNPALKSLRWGDWMSPTIDILRKSS